MNKLQFKTFTWPENPTRYSVVCCQEPQYDANGSFTGLGAPRKTITGSGAFFGSNAYTQFQTLLGLMTQTNAGALVHPVWGSCNAFLTELTLTQEPRADYVA